MEFGLFMAFWFCVFVKYQAPLYYRRKFKCTYEQAEVIWRKKRLKYWNEFLELLSPTAQVIGLLQNPAFCEDIGKVWQACTSVSISSLRSGEYVHFLADKDGKKRNFQCVWFEFVGTEEKMQEFLIAFKNLVNQHLQTWGVGNVLIHCFSNIVSNDGVQESQGKSNANHWYCNVYFSTNESEKKALVEFLAKKRQVRLQREKQAAGLNSCKDAELEQELKDAGI